MHVDVVVVGAGPAGSVAAYRLAASGAQVALLERATFPRDKVCGDGISARALEILARMGLADWSQQFRAPTVLRLVFPNGQVLEGRAPKGDVTCYGRVIPRLELDAALAQAAVHAGARLLEGTRVQAVEIAERNGVVVRARSTTVTASLLLLADGSHAPVTRSLGLVTSPPDLIAARQYVRGDAASPEEMEIHFNLDILPGYSWIFPVASGRANVGTGTFAWRVQRHAVDLRKAMQRFLESQTANGRRLARAVPESDARGHPIRSTFGKGRTHASRVLVAGDAAGLVSPLSGEGVAAAMQSGELAARHILTALENGAFPSPALTAYSRELRRRYAADWRAARFLQRALFAPQLLNHVYTRLQRDANLALLFGRVILGYQSPRLLLHPRVLLRFLL